MKNLLVLLACISLLGCDKVAETPECIQTQIDSYIANGQVSQSSCNSKAEVTLYEYQGAEVYTLFFMPCIADGGTNVVDADCNSIGFLGGIAGFTEVNGEDFYDNATLVRVVWKED